MRVEKAKEIFQDIVSAYNYFRFDWSKDDEYTFTDGEMEYQIRDYSNGEFCSILVRYCDDPTHTYIEFYPETDDEIEEIIYDAISDETADYLSDKIFAKVQKQLKEKENDYAD